MVAETFVSGIGTLTDRHDLVEEMATPDVAILDVIEAIIATGDKAIYLPWVTHLVVLAPVPS